MSDFYKGRRSKNIFEPASKEAFKLSRSRIELFMSCPRCFYIDRRLGVDRPPGFPFNLNSAVDHLLKKEFDVHRADSTAHPLMTHYQVDAIPFSHPMMNEWRENFKGVQYHHKSTNFMVTGAVDDIWVNPAGELIVVDYKATSKDTEVNLDATWQDSYRRQMEIYQWLLRKNGFQVSNIGYFVYCNGRRDAKAFDAKLEFDIKLLPHTGSDTWIEGVLSDIRSCLESPTMPAFDFDCDYCIYRKAVKDVITEME